MLLPPVRWAQGRDKRTASAILAFAVGVFAGGLTTGFLLWVLSGLIYPIPLLIRLAVLLVFALVALVREVGVFQFDLPSAARIIPQTTFSGSLALGALNFGFELGLGFRTRVYNAGPYLMALLVLLVGPSASSVALLALGWSLGRTFAVAIRLRRSLRQRELEEEETGIRTRYDQVLSTVSGRSANLATLSVAVFVLAELRSVGAEYW